MPRTDRANEFLFDPARFLNDEAVRVMRLEELGAYAALFCSLCQQPEPGVAPDDDRLLAFLARATPEEWARVKPGVCRALKLEQRPGGAVWVQKGLVETFAAQRERFRSRSKGASHAANSRWGREKDAARIGNGDADAMQVRLGKEREGEEEPTPSLPLGLVPVAPVSPEELAGAPWREAFDRFWAAWPRGVRGKQGKAETLKLWLGIRPRTAAKLAEILAGLERAKVSRQWQSEGGRYIPDPPRWLRRERWNDEHGEDGAGTSSLEAWARDVEAEQGGPDAAR